jgi:hypothetical protein
VGNVGIVRIARPVHRVRLRFRWKTGSHHRTRARS